LYRPTTPSRLEEITIDQAPLHLLEQGRDTEKKRFEKDYLMRFLPSIIYPDPLGSVSFYQSRIRNFISRKRSRILLITVEYSKVHLHHRGTSTPMRYSTPAVRGTPAIAEHTSVADPEVRIRCFKKFRLQIRSYFFSNEFSKLIRI
jgi:hypothetical protein